MFRNKVVLVSVVIFLITAVVALFVLVLRPDWRPWSAPAATSSPTTPPTATTTPTRTATPTSTSTPTITPTPSVTPVSQFGRIAFGTSIEALSASMAFSAGTEAVYALWNYQNMRDGMPWRLCWFLDDTPWSCESLNWDVRQYATSGEAYVTRIRERDGLPPGNYRLELFVEDRQVQFATFVILAPTLTPTLTPTSTPAPAPPLRDLVRDATHSLVRVWMPGEGAYGSGSIVDGSKGLVLTNWHVVADWFGELPEDGLAGIFLTLGPDLDPKFVFWAQVLELYSNPDADLAVLQITHWAEHDTPAEPPLNLPAIPLGDSDDVRRGDHVILLGYPDYAEGTLSWTEGVVVTRSEEWITTDALASYGHSGGMALNQRGELVGVISGGKLTGIQQAEQLSLVRPIDVAKPLIDGAVAGMIPLPPAPPVDDEYHGRRMVVLGVEELNLREGPGLSHPVLAQMPLGMVLEVLRAPEWDGARFWYNVRVLETGQVGWASEVYLASSEVAASPILFTSNRTGSGDVYSIYPDGTGLRQLTSAPGDEADPSWSPERSYIVFAYRQDDDYDLYSMDANGGSWKQLTCDETDEVHPVWSPDGSRIAYISNEDGDWELFVLNLDTETAQQLTFNNAWDSYPSWSPDGTRLVFTSRQTGNYDLFVVDTATAQVMQLTTSPYSDAHGSWSPVGEEIVYTMVVAEGDTLLRELGVLSLRDPAHPRRATFSESGKALHRYPDWSPDGRFVVFVSGDGDAAEIYVAPAHGFCMVSLTDAGWAASSAPSWSR